MEKKDMFFKLQEIFRGVLDNDEIVLTESTCANDIEEWDSLANVQLIVAIEREFGIRFTSLEIPSWKNVGDMVDCIQSKL